MAPSDSTAMKPDDGCEVFQVFGVVDIKSALRLDVAVFSGIRIWIIEDVIHSGACLLGKAR